MAARTWTHALLSDLLKVGSDRALPYGAARTLEPGRVSGTTTPQTLTHGRSTDGHSRPDAASLL
mgnify:CR=1 FL=1